MNPTGAVRAGMLLAALYLGASLTGCSTGDEVVEGDTCAMDELEVVNRGGDGAGGHTVTCSEWRLRQGLVS